MYLEQLIRQFEQIYTGDPWLEETYAKKLDSIDDQLAFTVAVNDLHSMAEIVAHVYAWKNEILNRWVTGKPSLKMHGPGDWPSNRELQKIGWTKIYANLMDAHVDLMDYLNSKTDDFLKEKYNHRAPKNIEYIEGLLHHDIYHLGQLGIVRKLLSLNT